MKKVVIDTDYFNFITHDLSDDSLFLEIIRELKYEPVMHEFVYKQELHEHSFVKCLVDKHIITIYDYDSLTKDQADATEYERLFKYAYFELNAKRFVDAMVIRDYRHEKENLGEIHSTILARLMGYDILMSNDGGAKSLAGKLSTLRSHIHVYNIEDTFTELITPEKSSIKWTKIKNVVKQLKNNGNKTDTEKYMRIRNKWVD